MKHSMKLELTDAGLLIMLANHYTSQGALDVNDFEVQSH